MYNKPVIVFEGIEGSGKTFHINNVSRFLKKKRIKFLKIREPGGSFNAEKIRNLILKKKIVLIKILIYYFILPQEVKIYKV